MNKKEGLCFKKKKKKKANSRIEHEVLNRKEKQKTSEALTTGPMRNISQ